MILENVETCPLKYGFSWKAWRFCMESGVCVCSEARNSYCIVSINLF
jgi:hypothetical protein